MVGKIPSSAFQYSVHSSPCLHPYFSTAEVRLEGEFETHPMLSPELMHKTS